MTRVMIRRRVAVRATQTAAFELVENSNELALHGSTLRKGFRSDEPPVVDVVKGHARIKERLGGVAKKAIEGDIEEYAGTVNVQVTRATTFAIDGSAGSW
jgi:hypothetical protein